MIQINQNPKQINISLSIKHKTVILLTIKMFTKLCLNMNA